MSSTSSQKLKKKKKIFIDVITYRGLKSIPFLASSLYLCLWFWRSVSIDFLIQSKGIAWTDNLETKAFSLSLFFETEIWSLELCLPYHLIKKKKKWIERRKDVDPFWTCFWVHLKKKIKDIDEDRSQAYCNLCFPYVGVFFSQKKN